MMKKLSLLGLISAALVIGFVFINCGGGSSPSIVVRQLYTAFEKGDTQKINELMTPESAQMMSMFAEKIRGQVTSSGGIVKTEHKINGDTAVVTATFKDGSTEDYDLVKIDGKWKVTIKK